MSDAHNLPPTTDADNDVKLHIDVAGVIASAGPLADWFYSAVPA